LYAIEAGAGPNRVLEKLEGISAVETLPAGAARIEELGRIFARWSPGSKALVPVYERTAPGAFSQGPGLKRTSDHLARLWAHGRVLELAASGEPKSREQAQALAARYRLVTPVTGAVVLETAEQYEEAGLKMAQAGQNPSIPTVPEPETWVLIGLAVAAAAWTLRRRGLEVPAA
jgi:hypothetical protein